MCTKAVRIAPLIVKILLFVVLPLNVICSLFSFVSPFWFYEEQDVGADNYTIKNMYGLWMDCNHGYYDIGKLLKENRCIKHENLPDYINTARIFLTVGTICISLCLLGTIWFVIRLKGLRIIAFCNVLSAISGIAMSVGVTIYGVHYRINLKSRGFDLHASFYVACISTFLCILTVISISLLIINYYSGSYAEDMSSYEEKFPPIRRPQGFNFRQRPGRQMRPPSFEYGKFQSPQMPGVRY